MEQRDFEELIGQVRELGASFARAYRDITGEELNIESAVRHYPLVAVGVAAGAGAVGGWFLARRGKRQLPAAEAPNPLDYIERFLPGGLEKVRELLPERLAEEAAASAKTWVDEVLEPSLREGLETAVDSVEHTRVGIFLKQTLRRLEGGEDHQLEDPD